ncbi:MAG TPA: DUF559 domain-containing protein [Polyangiaceae bacterium]|jgi:very-short-patch-repair endonuclease|nr:DUF559 domain-containing protein [Polyangiaceae bacterium]
MSHRKRSARSSVARTALLRSRARFMVHHPTDSEELLWQYLRGKRLLGVQFRRLVPLHGFIVDFHASSIKLAVEVDGGWHNEHTHLDAARDRKLRAVGVRVVRVSAEQVCDATPTVLGRIRAWLVVCVLPKASRRRCEPATTIGFNSMLRRCLTECARQGLFRDVPTDVR